MTMSVYQPMGSLVRWLRRNESGSTAVEAALIMPVLIFFTLGIIEFAMVMMDMNRANDATQRGVREMAIKTPVPDLSDMTDLDITPVTCTGDGGGGVSCNNGASVAMAASFNEMVTTMQLIYPNLTSANVTVTYGDTTGIDDDVERPGVNTPMITVALTGVTYTFMLGGVIPGMPNSVPVPSFSSSMVGPSIITGI